MSLRIMENNPEDAPEEQFVHIQQAFNGLQQWSNSISTNIALRNINNTAVTTNATSAVNLLSSSFTLQNALFRVDVNLGLISGATTAFTIRIDNQIVGTITDSVTSEHLILWTDTLQSAAGRHTLSISWSTTSGIATLNSSKVIITSYPN